MSKFAIAAALFGATFFSATAAYAWSIVDQGEGWAQIRCSDGSSAAVARGDDGRWSASRAGRNGSTGGSYAMLGQAALRACGE